MERGVSLTNKNWISFYARMLVILAVLFWTGPILAHGAQNISGTGTGVTYGTNIQVHEGEPVTGTVTQLVQSGIGVTVLSQKTGDDGEEWYLVYSGYPYVSGYIRSDFIQLGGIPAESISVNQAVTIDMDDVRVRDRASLSGKELCTLSYGTECNFLKAVYDEESGYYWYQVKFTETQGVSTGYVRSDYFEADIGSNGDYTGFPETYTELLSKLNKTYPGWTFTAYDPSSTLDWAGAVDAQYAAGSVVEETGISTSDRIKAIVEGNSSVSSDSALFETTINGPADPGQDPQEPLTDGDGQGGWVSRIISTYLPLWTKASKDQIRYYMDPRNFMVNSDGSVNPSFFMFVDGTDSTGTTEDGVSQILSTTSMTGTIPNEGKTYSGAVLSLSQEKKVNPYLVAARMRQEHGSKSGDELINGTYSGYEGYYNYFNIQANGSEPIVNGLKYAKSQGWNTRYKSISGGIAFLAEKYILSDTYHQNTLYKQRFNYKEGEAYHQYMTSLYAPHYEAKSVYAGYSGDVNSSSKYHFLIPVYRNMPDTPQTEP
ncbi:MAG: SH3 domain-containing protein [Lachnospiraceae bacterium]|nr:SH3 domain-containing protein [Lachnospiraceae bacterium]